MKITNPVGKKSIIIDKNQSQDIWIEDFENGNRDFELTVELIGENATCHIQARAQTNNHDKKNWKIVQKFRGKNQTGTINIRGVAEDESFLHIDGTAILEQSSEDASADISEKIMLSGNGRGKLLPVLRVETDKVKSASHGASIAPITSDTFLFFGRSGIDKKAAQEIIKEGFLK